MNLNQMLEEKGRLAAAIRQMGNAAHDSGGDFTAEQQPAWDRLNADYNANEKRIATERRRLADERIGLVREAFGPGRDIRSWLAEGSDQREYALDAMPASAIHDLASIARKTPASERNHLRIGAAAMSVGTAGAGGYTVPNDVVNRLELSRLWNNPVSMVAETFTTKTGSAFRLPMANDLSNTGSLILEGSTRGGSTASASAIFSQILFAAYKICGGQVIVSSELLRDSFDIFEPMLITMLGERIGRASNPYHTTGTGSGQPQGIVTGSTLGVTAASPTAVTADEIINLVYSVDKRFRPVSQFMASDTIIQVIRKLKDSSGRYLWIAGTNGEQDTVNGSPIVCNNDMSTAMTTGQKILLCGKLSDYKIRRVGGYRIIRLDEAAADTDSVSFDLVSREDGQLMDNGGHSVKHLKLA